MTTHTMPQKAAPAAASAKPGLPPARVGYKHTKLGWIPEEWKVTRFGDMTSLLTNGFVGTATTQYTDAPDGIPYVQGYNVKEFTIDYHGMCKVNRTFHEKNAKSRLRVGDLLTIQTGDIGVTAAVPDDLEGANCHALVISRFKEQEAFPGYYLQYLNAPIGRAMIRRIETGSTMKHINVGDLKREWVIQPTLPEQRRIAAVLGAWDRAMATVQQLLAAQQERKRGLMQELLTGRRRFKGFGGKWKSHRLGDLFERVTRKNAVGEEHVLTISAQHGLIDQREIFNKSVAGANLAGYYLLRNGEFAYNKSSSNGYPVGAIKRLDRYEQGILSVLYICFALKPGAANSDFMAAYFDAGMLDEGIGAIAQEGARNHGLLNVSTTDFFDLDVHIPDEAEQEAIAKAIGALNKETESIQNYLNHLTAQKRGLMQQLLTGQIRVKA